MTILDACVEILKEAGKPMTAEDIYKSITEKGLYTFGAKDPLAILRGTLRKHVRSNPPHRIAEDEPKRYRAV